MAGLLWIFSSSGSLGSRGPALSKDKQLAELKLETVSRTSSDTDQYRRRLVLLFVFTAHCSFRVSHS